MMEVAFTLCLIGAPDTCEERRIAFAPAQPIACIFAAAPELARAVPEGWVVVQWRCVAPPAR